MIISRTPFRVSFAGGGTDLRAFYGHEPGAVTSITAQRRRESDLRGALDNGDGQESEDGEAAAPDVPSCGSACGSPV